jgi:hypothetical protein
LHDFRFDFEQVAASDAFGSAHTSNQVRSPC